MVLKAMFVFGFSQSELGPPGLQVCVGAATQIIRHDQHTVTGNAASRCSVEKTGDSVA